jgi:sigma-B regulation protein RsbU (phosphoserine phosphatase)
MATLTMLKGPQSGQVFELEPSQSEIVLGRDPACAVIVAAPMISRRHARFSCVDGSWSIEDLGSRNGTFVNGKKIEGRQPISEQDRIKFGELLFTFHAAGGAVLPDAVEEQAPGTIDLGISDDDGEQSNILATLDSSSSGGIRLDVKPENKLRAVLEITNNLNENLELGDVLPKILDSVFRIFPQADRGFLLLKDADSDRLLPKAVRYRHADDDSMRISRTIVRKAMTDGQAILSADATSDDRFDGSQSIADFQIRSLMCAPLVARGGDPLGVIQVDSQDSRRQFAQEDLDVLAAVANQAAIAVQHANMLETILAQERVQKDVQFAQTVQQSFLPKSQPALEGYAFYDFYQPARTIGGDYFDYIPLPDGRLGVVVADVSGKGVAAALLMARASAETRYNLAAADTPAEAITRLNASLAALAMEGRFLTFVLAVVDPATHQVTFVNAGHMAPLLRRKGEAELREIGEEQIGVPLGVLEDFEYEQTSIELEPGDTLVFYTDGVSEAMNPAGELFDTVDEPRIARAVLESESNAAAIGEMLVGRVREWADTRDQSDDICLVTLGRT